MGYNGARTVCTQLYNNQISIYYLGSAKRGKERNSFEKCHIVHDSTSFVVTATMTILGAIFIKEQFNKTFFIIIMTEMQLFGLLLKGTYYLYMHPWEDMNPRHSTNVLWHKIFTGCFILCLLVTVIAYSGSTLVRIFIVALISLFAFIGVVSSIIFPKTITYSRVPKSCIHNTKKEYRWEFFKKFIR